MSNNKIILDGIITNVGMILASINHLIEINVICYDEFSQIAGRYLENGLYNLLTIEDLLYKIFPIEYSLYIRPLLQVADDWTQFEAAYDRYFFTTNDKKFGYRINKINQLTTFDILEYNLQTITYRKLHTSKTKIERMFHPVSKTSTNSHSLK